ncbi:MAG: bifunctional folylpolyglutamate synthase/dihydrofolate synthase [Oscillospiraceae bacterium]|nr:bifunctional folylpolyglutamate synthase/dihydrofolate synthase [Oscillospiraceae bacterium]
MNYQEALDYLKQASARGARLGLARVRELADRLGNPQRNLRVIHIAGTNGKGSVGAMLAAVLHAAGIRTGHFASPALCSVNEYYRIDGEPASDETFASLLTEVQAQAEQMTDPPTEFEILAAAAYLLFAKEKCGASVIECCMGGGTDCTNVIEYPVLSVITNIRKDHCAFLGNTIAEIALQKAGIIKEGCPVLIGCRNSEALRVIDAYAKRLHAPAEHRQQIITETEFSLSGTRLGTLQFGSLYLPLLGMYQPENAALVLQAVTILRRQGFEIPDDAVRQGLSACRWHGRFELLSQNPAVIFDGAHNPDGMRKTAESLACYFGKRQNLVFVTGVMADKEYRCYPEMLKPLAAQVYTVKPDNPRALDAEKLCAVYAEAGIPAHSCITVTDALVRACSSGMPVIGLGSLYLYREFVSALNAAQCVPDSACKF